MRERDNNRISRARALWVVLAALGSVACVTSDEPSSSARSSLRSTDDGGTDDASRVAETSGASTRQIVERLLAAHPGPAATALRAADEVTLREYGAAVRGATAASLAGPGTRSPPELIHDEHATADRRETTPDGDQSNALDRLADATAGRLRVRWDDALEGPAALERLWFVRRDMSERAVVEAFLDEHADDVRALWKVGSRSELVVSSVRPLDDEATVVDIDRRVDGVPVLGEWFEAHVSSARSRFGRGVLTRFGATVRARPAVPIAVTRDRWISVEAARRAARSTGRPMGGRLVYLRGATLRPAWMIQDEEGRASTVDAISGELLGTHDARSFLGPTHIQGWPPGATLAQPIRLRAANVADSLGQSLGSTAWWDGSHSFVTNGLTMQLAGPVGWSNPDAIGRVYRTSTVAGSIGDPVPLGRAWNAQYQHDRDFGNPDAWAPNTGSIPFPHATEITYGWLSYWQNLVGRKVGLQVPDRLEFRLYPWQGEAWGVAAGSELSDDLSQPDENGATNFGCIDVAVGAGDDLQVGGAGPSGEGDDIVRMAHEFGHAIVKCAAAPGSSCLDVPPGALTVSQRSAYGPSDWRPAVWDGHSEMNAYLLAQILTQFRYRANGLVGAPFDAAWNYVSYDATIDSFGSPTQSNAAPSNCLASGAPACPSGYRCVPAAMHQATDPGISTAGWCEPVCAVWSDLPGTPTDPDDDTLTSTSSCPQGLDCLDRGAYQIWDAQVCWHSQYANKFFDSVGVRLASMVGWRRGLLASINAVSGQSANPKRDLVLGADSYAQRYALSPSTRYEASRAVRAVYRGTGYAAADDFPDVLPHGAILPLRSHDWAYLWWGNGVLQYLNSEDMSDVDSVLFYGLAGQRVVIESLYYTATTAPAFDLWRADGAAPNLIASSLSGSLTTDPLPVSGWYILAFVPQSVGSWYARVKLDANSDDFSTDLDEAWPLVHGDALAAVATASDTDAFTFDVPTSAIGSDLTVTVTAPFAASLTVSRRTGATWTAVGTWPTASGTTDVTLPAGTTASRLGFAITASGGGEYSVRATLACASASPACDVTQSPLRAAVPTWGDRFAGRLDGATPSHDYTITLATGDQVSVAVTDNDTACRARVVVYPPLAQRHFQSGPSANQPVFSWDDGAPLNHITADTFGAGGHFEAATDGTYRIRVQPQPGLSCPWYRLHIAKVYPSLDSMPPW